VSKTQEYRCQRLRSIGAKDSGVWVLKTQEYRCQRLRSMGVEDSGV